MRTRNNKTHKKTYKKKTLNKRKPKNTTVKKIKKRKIVKGGEPNEREDDCAICLETLNNPDNPDITLSCQHKFHRNCMIDTCKNKRGNCLCPLCRKVLSLDDLNILEISPTEPVPLAREEQDINAMILALQNMERRLREMEQRIRGQQH
jgi:hypothetical protein